MAKRLQEYVKYSIKELNQYSQTKGSCVRKVNTNLHLAMGPFCLSDFKHVLLAHLMRSKVGFYDVHLDGIVLDVKKIKVLGTTGAIRADDPKIHVDINADVYVFKPEEGAELTGVVKHIGPHQVGVIMYRVFNANLRVEHKLDKNEIQMDQEVKFRIRKYNLQNIFPYIDGQLLTPGSEKCSASGKKIIFKQEDNVDSGIEEKDGSQELEDLLSLIKTEEPSTYEEALEESKKKRVKKSKRDNDITKNANIADSNSPSNNYETVSAAIPEGIQTLSGKSTKKVATTISSDDSFHPTPKKSKLKLTSNDESLSATRKKSKHEVTSSDEVLSPTPKKIKKEISESNTKRHKSKTTFSEHDVKIKNEIKDDV